MRNLRSAAGSLHSLGGHGRKRFTTAPCRISERSFCGQALSSAVIPAPGAAHSHGFCRLSGLGLGGTIGTGKQGISWIHEMDMNRLFERALADINMRGIYIATAPKPVSQRVFMREMRKVVGMPIGLPAFRWMVRIAAPMLGTDPELALYGRYLVSRRLAEMPFEFKFPNLSDALADVLAR